MNASRDIGLLVLVIASLTACGGNDIIEATCDEPQAYQSIVPAKKVVVPDGLDPLDEFKELPVPKAETPPRPPGSKCIESAPSVLTGSAGSG